MWCCGLTGAGQLALADESKVTVQYPSHVKPEDVTVVLNKNDNTATVRYEKEEKIEEHHGDVEQVSHQKVHSSETVRLPYSASDYSVVKHPHSVDIVYTGNGERPPTRGHPGFLRRVRSFSSSSFKVQRKKFTDEMID